MRSRLWPVVASRTQVVGLGQELPGLGQDLYASRGRGDGAAGAVQQPDPQELFERAQGAGDAGLARPQPTTDYLGITLALLAAGCWASYILLNRVIGRRLPGAEGSAAAAGLSALLYVPVGVITLMRHPPTAGALG
jgi:hypothetical protein